MVFLTIAIDQYEKLECGSGDDGFGPSVQYLEADLKYFIMVPRVAFTYKLVDITVSITKKNDVLKIKI